MSKKHSWNGMVQSFILDGKYAGFIHRAVSSSKDLSRNMVLSSDVATAVETYASNGSKIHPTALEWWHLYRIFSRVYRENARAGVEGFPDVALDYEEFAEPQYLPENEFKIPHGSVER